MLKLRTLKAIWSVMSCPGSSNYEGGIVDRDLRGLQRKTLDFGHGETLSGTMEMAELHTMLMTKTKRFVV